MKAEIDESILRLDARLGALELLLRNLYADRYIKEPDPIAAVHHAADQIAELSKFIRVLGTHPVVADALAAEAEDVLNETFGEIVQIVEATVRERTDPCVAEDGAERKN